MRFPDECGGGTLFSDLGRWLCRQPAWVAVLALVLALTLILSLT